MRDLAVLHFLDGCEIRLEAIGKLLHTCGVAWHRTVVLASRSRDTGRLVAYLFTPPVTVRWSPAAAIVSLALVAALLTTLVLAIAVKLVQRVRRGFRGGGGGTGGDGSSWRERLPFGRRSYAVRVRPRLRRCPDADPARPPLRSEALRSADSNIGIL